MSSLKKCITESSWDGEKEKKYTACVSRMYNVDAIFSIGRMQVVVPGNW